MELTREKATRLRAAMDTAGQFLTDEQAVYVPELYRPWTADAHYAAGDRRLYDGVLYKCLQEHDAQPEWVPPYTTSLWARVLIPDPTVIPVWEQPDSTNPYMTGDKVHYPDENGPVYESTIDNNVWSPADYPAGWKEV